MVLHFIILHYLYPNVDIPNGIKILNVLLEVWQERQDLFQEDFVNAFLMWVTCKCAPLTDVLEKIAVQLLSDSKLKINTTVKQTDSPLIHFTKIRSLKVVQMLLERKQDVNHIGKMGKTALHHIIEG